MTPPLPPRTGKPAKPLLERFEACLPVRLESQECWIWTGKPDRHGYGRIRLPRRGKSMLAHRVAWEAHHAEQIPAGLCVCHQCDTPLCVNPLHLFLGTPLTNNTDRSLKNRSAKGTNHHKAKLYPDQVLFIRRMHANGWRTKAQLSRQFGVADTSIHLIISRRNWKHVS